MPDPAPAPATLPGPHRPRPLALAWVALVALFVACAAFAFIRIDPTDTPTHLVTAREFFRTGHWLATNTFSYTYPDAPVFQQYPVYQATLYLVYRALGFEGLSLLVGILGLLLLALWMRWGGSWAWAATLSPLWALALLGFRERICLRPDLFTILWLVLLLHAVDQYRRGRVGFAALFVVLQWLMANTHQLFTLGLATQAAFVVHLLVVRWARGRWGVARDDAALPVWPAALALAVSLPACLLTPISLKMLEVPLHTTSSLVFHKQRIAEFASIFGSPYRTTLFALSAAAAAAGLWLTRRRWQPFEVALWIMGIALACAATRGLVFHTFLSAGIAARCLARWTADRATAPSAPVRTQAGGCWALPACALTLCACLVIVAFRWVWPARGLGGPQPGLGRTMGDWPDAALAFLQVHPPPGRMLNLTFYSGNGLVWGLFPEHKVWIDPRFESYPRQFIVDAIAAETDPATLDRLVQAWQPSWMVAEVRHAGCRQQVARLLASGQWQLVYADTVFLVLVRDTPENQAYLARHRLAPDEIAPTDWLVGEPDLLALQKQKMAALFRDLGLPERAEKLLQSK